MLSQILSAIKTLKDAGNKQHSHSIPHNAAATLYLSQFLSRLQKTIAVSFAASAGGRPAPATSTSVSHSMLSKSCTGRQHEIQLYAEELLSLNAKTSPFQESASGVTATAHCRRQPGYVCIQP